MDQCRNDAGQASGDEDDRHSGTSIQTCMVLRYGLIMSIQGCMVTRRLSRQDWLDAAMTNLAKHGHQSLRAERLAKLLGVSRGSFYWHFSDVENFEQAVLAHWETVSVDLPYASATEGQDLSTALPKLIRKVFRSPVALERAVRSWATISPMAARVLSRVDQRRLSLLAKLIPSSEASPDKTNARALILYWAYLGHVTMAETNVDDVVITALVEQLCIS